MCVIYTINNKGFLITLDTVNLATDYQVFSHFPRMELKDVTRITRTTNREGLSPLVPLKIPFTNIQTYTGHFSCSSVIFPVDGPQYSQMCGQATIHRWG